MTLIVALRRAQAAFYMALQKPHFASASVEGRVVAHTTRASDIAQLMVAIEEVLGSDSHDFTTQ
jgi:hypothetical protein